MKRISMLEMRRNAAGVVEGLRRGEAYLLTFRRQPVGELRPIPAPSREPSKDPVYGLMERAEDLGETMDARAADDLIYNR